MEKVFAIFGFIIITFVLGAICGDTHARRDEHALAIKANCAEWRIDSKTGERTFYWLSGETNAIAYK